MRFFASLICAMLVLQSASARSNDISATDLLFEIAVEAATRTGDRYAYTVDHWGSENGKEKVWHARFDPRRALGDQWRLVGVEPDNMDKNARKMLKRLQKIEDGDDKLVYDKLDELIVGAVLQSETEDEAIFVIPLEDEELPKGVMEAEITLNKTAGYVSQIDVRSVAEFKPNAVVKLKSMKESQRFEAPTDDSPAFLTLSESAAEGKAMFKSFKAQSREVISDIEVIDPADLPSQQD